LTSIIHTGSLESRVSNPVFYPYHKHAHIPLQPPPPAWLEAALEVFRNTETYANDQFEVFMRYSAVDTTTDTPVQMPSANAPLPPNVRFYFLPRIRCLDCPGKLYTPGPEMTAQNFEVHLKHKAHKEKVEARLNGVGTNSAA
jgi:SWI/SNF-related matrix-associated actin-dependent regulator of chromatin subfamily B member 1